MRSPMRCGVLLAFLVGCLMVSPIRSHYHNYNNEEDTVAAIEALDGNSPSVSTLVQASDTQSSSDTSQSTAPTPSDSATNAALNVAFGGSDDDSRPEKRQDSSSNTEAKLFGQPGAASGQSDSGAQQVVGSASSNADQDKAVQLLSKPVNPPPQAEESQQETDSKGDSMTDFGQPVPGAANEPVSKEPPAPSTARGMLDTFMSGVGNAFEPAKQAQVVQQVQSQAPQQQIQQEQQLQQHQQEQEKQNQQQQVTQQQQQLVQQQQQTDQSQQVPAEHLPKIIEKNQQVSIGQQQQQQANNNSTLGASTSLSTARTFGDGWSNCVGSSTSKYGSCKNDVECKKSKGEPDGSCMGGLGVCCVMALSCGDKSLENNTFFANPDFPEPSWEARLCEVEIKKKHDKILQVMIEFEEFELAPPNHEGECITDVFEIKLASKTPSPYSLLRICGQNAGQHLYLDVSQIKEPLVLSLATSGGGFPRRWSIRIIQMDEKNHLLAPPGCLQYYTDTIGHFRSFNLGRNLKNLYYAICFRIDNGYSGVRFTSNFFGMNGPTCRLRRPPGALLGHQNRGPLRLPGHHNLTRIEVPHPHHLVIPPPGYAQPPPRPRYEHHGPSLPPMQGGYNGGPRYASPQRPPANYNGHPTTLAPYPGTQPLTRTRRGVPMPQQQPMQQQQQQATSSARTFDHDFKFSKHEDMKKEHDLHPMHMGPPPTYGPGYGQHGYGPPPPTYGPGYQNQQQGYYQVRGPYYQHEGKAKWEGKEGKWDSKEDKKSDWKWEAKHDSKDDKKSDWWGQSWLWKKEDKKDDKFGWKSDKKEHDEGYGPSRYGYSSSPGYGGYGPGAPPGYGPPHGHHHGSKHEGHHQGYGAPGYGGAYGDGEYHHKEIDKFGKTFEKLEYKHEKNHLDKESKKDDKSWWFFNKKDDKKDKKEKYFQHHEALFPMMHLPEMPHCEPRFCGQSDVITFPPSGDSIAEMCGNRFNRGHGPKIISGSPLVVYVSNRGHNRGAGFDMNYEQVFYIPRPY